jgi:hypothetical protein
MADDDARIGGGQLARWLLLAICLLFGIGLYFWLAPGSQPIVHSPGTEDSP